MCKSENPGSGHQIGYRQEMENQESNAVQAGDYFYVANYREGVIKRWLADLGAAYRGHLVETVTDEEIIPEPVALRFYNQRA